MLKKAKYSGLAVYRFALTLLTLMLVVLAFAYYHEHQRAEIGVRVLNTTRQNSQAVEQERDALKKQNLHLQEQALLWHGIWLTKQPCFGTINYSDSEKFAMDEYENRLSPFEFGEATKRVGERQKVWERERKPIWEREQARIREEGIRELKHVIKKG